MTDLPAGFPRRITMRAPRSGSDKLPDGSVNLIGRLPFDPHDFTVGEPLVEALTDINDANTLNCLQAFDKRTTAAAYYERRIKELAEEAKEA